ncbi:subunit Sec62 of preprotein translocase [Ordospora colligata]|uniref:Translocation protein SEC62 n=1 Tax=Ordospora colligata OC4 TaxID=1354746 RepID=A0A0B2UJW5_9MICR|nr:subunit Sec62 of preprotein translocase [Ordospora colligata OC4]KHN69332.1 subunit Sec62 of preprotein translocase [Ordospora colligata OC4]TBU14846.1 subunit Sec62 of preprotein translocase [Ordospora colligata]TBU14977.1 subunit Sec62 of preprotein translocase [Ordospora colligata]TBU18361.1 subunit Sec62 of preprotein translocase [Ordospora colligata]
MNVDLKKYEGMLRKVSAEEKTLRYRKRILVFTGVDALALLMKNGIDAEQAKCIMQDLLDESILFKIALNRKNTRDCDVMLDQKFHEEHKYVFADEKTSNTSLLICGAFVLIILSIVLFKMWPRHIQQRAFSLMMYPLGGFVAFIIVIAIIRFVLFVATYFVYPPGIWLFPRLFEDVGFFESFVPVWEYHGKRTKCKVE